MASSNGNRSSWRLLLRLPKGYETDTPALFAWLRDELIPAILHAPLRITLELRPPEDDRPEV